ncbi:MAG TPA: hypothetical protein VIV06_06130 [Candidatus Limnocylindrales bacterium]
MTALAVARVQPRPATPTASSRPRPTLASLPALSDLDRVQLRLAREHDRHASGPVFPCPLCFKS